MFSAYLTTSGGRSVLFRAQRHVARCRFESVENPSFSDTKPMIPGLARIRRKSESQIAISEKERKPLGIDDLRHGGHVLGHGGKLNQGKTSGES